MRIQTQLCRYTLEVCAYLYMQVSASFAPPNGATFPPFSLRGTLQVLICDELEYEEVPKPLGLLVT